MGFLMTVFFENGFSENYLPNVDNRKVPTGIRPYISGLKNELMLDIEVWSNKWKINRTSQYTLMYKGDAVTSMALENGMVLEGTVKADNTVFSVKIDEVTTEATHFQKYLIKEGSILKLQIGSDDLCDIVYKNRFLTGVHAEIMIEAENAFVEDKNSVNGTFLNGRLITQRTKLSYGDIIYAVGLKIVYLNNLLAINNPDGQCKIRNIDKISIPKFAEENEEVVLEDKEDYFLRTPRRVMKLDTEKVSIEKCQKKQKQKRQPMIFTIGPSFTMIIPIALAAVMSGGEGLGMGGLMMSVGAAAIGAVWAVVNVNYAKKEEAESESSRVNKFVEYVVKIEEVLKSKKDYNTKVLEEQYPSSQEMLGFVKENTRRLWEKSSTHTDFLSVRLGLGTVASPNFIEVAKEEIGGEHDPLNDHIYEIKEQYQYLKNIPVAVSVYDNRMIGIVSADTEKRNEMVRAFSLQIAGAHPYTDVRLCYIFSGRDLEEMAYAKWLPHTKSPDGKLRMLACDAKTVGDIMYALSGMIRERLEEEEKKKEGEGELKTLPHYVIIIRDISLIAEEAISKYLMNPPKEAGFSVIFVADAIDKIPANCTAIVQNDDTYKGCYSTLSLFEEKENITFDAVNHKQIDEFARNLANFKVRETGTSAAIPDTISFLDMYKTSKVEDLDIYHKWLENRTYESMKSMIGYKSGEQPLYLDIHEKYHGPHGLVAGTTGSGKSETLQSYILSLVVNYHPHEVSFILIDYKGGGMAQSFEGLPHLAGMITNLGGNQTNRALLSINAEIKRRQRIFNEYKIKHIDAYIELFRNGEADEPMPHLLIIDDEFA